MALLFYCTSKGHILILISQYSSDYPPETNMCRHGYEPVVGGKTHLLTLGVSIKWADLRPITSHHSPPKEQKPHFLFPAPTAHRLNV